MKKTKKIITILMLISMISSFLSPLCVNALTSGDVKITAVDLLRIQKHILKYTTLKDEYYEACDTNYDNSVSPVDMLRIQKHILKYITLK